jgi:riboflavin synthase
MFNGIIFNTGIIRLIKKDSNSIIIGVETKLKFTQKDLGMSVACNGMCLTVTKIRGKIINFYISKESLQRSNFNSVTINQIINLEKSLTYGQKISGNFTQGHVDTIAKIKKIIFLDKTWIIKFQIQNKKLNKYLAEKASISINGVSLTISKVRSYDFEINVIPHTLKLTNLKNLKINDMVNVELDIFSKYIYKYSI